MEQSGSLADVTLHLPQGALCGMQDISLGSKESAVQLQGGGVARVAEQAELKYHASEVEEVTYRQPVPEWVMHQKSDITDQISTPGEVTLHVPLLIEPESEEMAVWQKSEEGDEVSEPEEITGQMHKVEPLMGQIFKPEDIVGQISELEDITGQIFEPGKKAVLESDSEYLFDQTSLQLIEITGMAPRPKEITCCISEAEELDQNYDVEEAIAQTSTHAEKLFTSRDDDEPLAHNSEENKVLFEKSTAEGFAPSELLTQDDCVKEDVIFSDSTILLKDDTGIVFWDMSEPLDSHDIDDCRSAIQLPERYESSHICDSHNAEKASVFSESVRLLKEHGTCTIFTNFPRAADCTSATLRILDLMAVILEDIQGKEGLNIDDCDPGPKQTSKVEFINLSIGYLDIALQKNPSRAKQTWIVRASVLHIHDFPDEILHYMLSLFSLRELCQFVAPVCKKWRDMAYDPIHWQQLKVGDLSSEHLGHCIQRAPLLKKLDLGLRNELTANETTLFAWGCPQLSELDLAFCDTLDNCLLQIISDTCKNLQQINLEGCRFVNDNSLMLLSSIPKLSCVNLSHCSLVQTEGVETLARNLSCITELDIDGIPDIEDSAIFALVEHHAKHMKRLSVDGEELTDAAVKAFTKFPVLVQLKVSFAELFTDAALSYLKNMKLLSVLKLKKGCDLSAEHLLDLFMSGSLSLLQSLDLTDCVHLHDDGIIAMVKCCGHNLRDLVLCWCWNITDLGLNTIIMGCPQLEMLHLVGLKKIRGFSLTNIPQSMPRLVLLDLQQCNQVIDDLVISVVHHQPQLIAYNYYGECFKPPTSIPHSLD